MKTYQYLDDIKPFEDIADFRKLYDEIVAEEVDAASQSDGDFENNQSVLRKVIKQRILVYCLKNK